MGAYTFIDFITVQQGDGWETAWKKWHTINQPQSREEAERDFPGWTDGYGVKNSVDWMGIITKDDVADLNNQAQIRWFCSSLLEGQCDDGRLWKWGPAAIMHVDRPAMDGKDLYVVFGWMSS